MVHLSITLLQLLSQLGMSFLASLLLLISQLAVLLLLFLFLHLFDALGEVLLKHAVKHFLELIILGLLLLRCLGRRSNAARLGRRVLKVLHHIVKIALELSLSLGILS